MKKPKIEELVMARLFPAKKDSDPSDWTIHVRRNLLQEVRLETIRFYGAMDCLEAQYPGLDYNNPSHRMRLTHFTNHRRLFRAFDELRLSNGEIQKLCKWEGTRWARKEYEANSGRKIKDTTYDGVADCRNEKTTIIQNPQVLHRQHKKEGSPGDADISDHDLESGIDDEVMTQPGQEHSGPGDESDDELQQSVGVELNQRLLAATEARARGENATLDSDWEQWLKEALERGTLPEVPHLLGSNPSMRADTPRTPVYWGREIPAYLTDHPSPVMATIYAQLPPPPQYFPGVLSTPSEASTILTSTSSPPTS
ncbi:hypothetical protein P7C71_g1524, partial [Lecanoromycetidae sp. Uapishka_2]